MDVLVLMLCLCEPTVKTLQMPACQSSILCIPHSVQLYSYSIHLLDRTFHLIIVFSFCENTLMGFKVFKLLCQSNVMFIGIRYLSYVNESVKSDKVVIYSWLKSGKNLLIVVESTVYACVKMC